MPGWGHRGKRELPTPTTCAAGGWQAPPARPCPCGEAPVSPVPLLRAPTMFLLSPGKAALTYREPTALSMLLLT